MAMLGKWTEQFEEFGADRYAPQGQAKLFRTTCKASLSHSARLAALKNAVMGEVEREPGVYGMLDDTDRLIYVGKSKALRNRLISYFLPNNEEEKAGRIIQSAKTIVWEYHPNELNALLREQWLIRTWMPRMNVVGMPNRQQQAYLCLGKGPGEQFYVSRFHDPEARCSVGPLAGVSAIFRAVEILTRFFKLRDCSQKTPMFLTDQLSLFDMEERAGCIRYELQNCLAPCMTNCNRAFYQAQVSDACRFLMGEEFDIATGIETEMLRAAQRHHFEYAQRLKEDLRIVRWLSKRLQQYRKSRSDGPVLYCLASRSLANPANRPVWYLLRKGGLLHVCYQPRNQKEWNALQKILSGWRTAEETVGLGALDPEDTLGLMTSWLQNGAKKLIKSAPESSYHWSIKADRLPEDWQDVKTLLKQHQSEAELPQAQQPSEGTPVA